MRIDLLHLKDAAIRYAAVDLTDAAIRYAVNRCGRRHAAIRYDFSISLKIIAEPALVSPRKLSETMQDAALHTLRFILSEKGFQRDTLRYALAGQGERYDTLRLAFPKKPHAAIRCDLFFAFSSTLRCDTLESETLDDFTGLKHTSFTPCN